MAVLKNGNSAGLFCDMLMIVLLSLAQILASLSNAVMDVLTFRWYRSIFKKWADQWLDSRPDLSEWIQHWMGPLSWENKYHFGKLTFLFKTALVFATDGWHFFKEVKLTIYQLTIISLAWPDLPGICGIQIIDGICYLLLFKMIHGLTFELSYHKLLSK